MLQEACALFKHFINYNSAIGIRVLKNIIPDKKLKHKLHLYQNRLMLHSNNYISVNDYYKKCNIKEKCYNTKTSKVFIVNDFYVNTFKWCTLMHDGKRNVLSDGFPPYKNGDGRDLVYDEYMNINIINTIYIDEAVNFALKWEDNYWHFTFSVLAKLLMFEEEGFKGKYLIFDRPFTRELIELLGIPLDKVVFVKEKDCFKVKTLHVVKNYNKYDFNMSDIVRKKICDNIDMSDISKYPKRLYIRRIGKYNRQVKNENEVLNLLKKYNFETFFPDDYSVKEQIKHFYAADIIVCPHGGCSTNAQYMKPDSHFVECFSYTYLNPCMLDVIKNIGIYYHMVVERECVKPDRSADFSIDTVLLDDIIYKFVEPSVKSITSLQNVQN